MEDRFWKNPVFIIAASVIFILVIIGVVATSAFEKAATVLNEFTQGNFGWLYLITVFLLTVFLFVLAVSKYGSIRLGKDNSKPEFSFFSWVGMLFSTGFGVGLVFWGVAEPMSHYFKSPFSDVPDQSAESARVAMGYAFFHWGISQWAIFALVGMVIGFLQFRKNKDGLVSTALEPIVGTNRKVKTGIDSFAVIATVMGIATSIGLGVMQMAGGFEAVLGWKNGFPLQLGIIVVIFGAYMLSASTGLNKGIRYLGTFNLALAIVLLVFFFIVGPKVFILETFTLAIGDYISNFIQYSLRLQPYQGGTWVNDWTIFYWAWTISWSPFVGAFVARVSKGRTIREFIFGVMIIPPLFAMLWIAVLGGTALYSDLNNGTAIAEAVNADVTSALFVTMETLPFSTILSVLAIILVITFLVTSADSATYILASMTTNGNLTPPLSVKTIWGVLMSAIAGVLLMAGGLGALETASLVSALPFTILLLLLIISMSKLLSKEALPVRAADVRRFERIRKESRKQNGQSGTDQEKK